MPSAENIVQQPATNNETATVSAVQQDEVPGLAREGVEGNVSGVNMDILMDVDMRLTVELGRARLKFRDVLNLTPGSVVELARLTSEPVDIMVNGALLATGEVVVVDEQFAVRITKLLNQVERFKRVL